MQEQITGIIFYVSLQKPDVGGSYFLFLQEQIKDILIISCTLSLSLLLRSGSAQETCEHLGVVLGGLEPPVEIDGKHRERQRDHHGPRKGEHELAALRGWLSTPKQLPHVRDRLRMRLGEPGGGAAALRGRREPRYHVDARAKYGGQACTLCRRRVAGALFGTMQTSVFRLGTLI